MKLKAAIVTENYDQMVELVEKLKNLGFIAPGNFSRDAWASYGGRDSKVTIFTDGTHLAYGSLAWAETQKRYTIMPASDILHNHYEIY